MKYFQKDGKCIVTGREGIDLHHIKTRGAGGKDQEWNLLPVCHAIHQEIHQTGLYAASTKYPQILRWLKENGWQIDFFSKKWVQVKHEI